MAKTTPVHLDPLIRDRFYTHASACDTCRSTLLAGREGLIKAGVQIAFCDVGWLHFQELCAADERFAHVDLSQPVDN